MKERIDREKVLEEQQGLLLCLCKHGLRNSLNINRYADASEVGLRLLCLTKRKGIMGKMYIGRTMEYYEPDEDSMFVNDLWTYSEDADDKDFAGEVHELSEEAAKELDWWLRCRRMNEWERRNSFNPDMRGPESVWNSLVKQSVKLEAV